MGTIIAGLALAMVTYGVDQAIRMYGNNISTKLQTMAKQLYTKISKNNQLLEQLTDAYNRKDNELLTELLSGAGFGARAQALKDARDTNTKTYQDKKQQISDENTKYQNAYNQVSQASYNTGDIAGIKQGQQIASDNSINQLVKGGLNK